MQYFALVFCWGTFF